MQNFRTYQLAIDLVKSCQELKLYGPKQDQLERALPSVPLNLAEGSVKPTAKDRKKFYYIAFGSLREVQTILQLYGTPALIQKADTVAASCYRLCTRT